MLKKFLAVLLLPLLLAGCATTFTNLTPQQQERVSTNLYPVEVSLMTRQQTLRWTSIQPHIVIGEKFYPMRATPLLTNRWEGLVPVPADTNVVYYRYKFNFEYNSFGAPSHDSYMSPIYTLKVIDK